MRFERERSILFVEAARTREIARGNYLLSNNVKMNILYGYFFESCEIEVICMQLRTRPPRQTKRVKVECARRLSFFSIASDIVFLFLDFRDSAPDSKFV